MDAVKPMPVGIVTSLIGAPLRADVTFDRQDEALARYEIELVSGRKSDRSTAWAKPLWRMTSDEPQFVALDDHRAFEGMLIDRRRPAIRMEAAQPIDAYSWVLRQDGDVVDAGTAAREGIAPDGLSFGFRPEERLRRSGRPGKARRRGVFYPPFESHLPGMPRTDDSRIYYTALTHAGHDDHDAYAVDFNWGAGGADRGHWVRSAAAGRVTRVDPSNGQVHIEHPQFDGATTYQTIYAHLDPVLVKEGDRVRTQQRIGRIGSTYYGSSEISPHLHHQHRRDGEPMKMNLLIYGKEVPIGVSLRAPSRTIVWDRKVPGWIRPRGPAPARLAVRARRASDGKWSRQHALRFIVTATKAGVPPEQDALFGPPLPPAAIAHEYAGPEVAPGEYTLRYRALGDAGTQTPWAYDDSIVVEPALA